LNWENVSNDVAGLAPRYRDEVWRPNLRRQVAYEIQVVGGDRIIAANEEDLRVDYRCRVEDPNLYDAQFTMALAHLLGAELAIPLVGTMKCSCMTVT
jgi:hypothetical protein